MWRSSFQKAHATVIEPNVMTQMRETPMIFTGVITDATHILQTRNEVSANEANFKMNL